MYLTEASGPGLGQDLCIQLVKGSCHVVLDEVQVSCNEIQGRRDQLNKFKSERIPDFFFQNLVTQASTVPKPPLWADQPLWAEFPPASGTPLGVHHDDDDTYTTPQNLRE